VRDDNPSDGVQGPDRGARKEKQFLYPSEVLAVVRSNEFGWPIVLKADGLAAGKGVVIAEDSASAESALAAAMGERRFGAAGRPAGHRGMSDRA
jgi:phosphoribosylamine-glycine ligase